MMEAGPELSQWFDDLPTIGRMPAEQAASKLTELGDDLTARGNRPWEWTAHAFGFIAKEQTPGLNPIVHAGRIAPDLRLKNGRIKITLDRIRVAGYPGGGGVHQILFDFYGQNQVPNLVEHLHFNATFRAQEGQSVGIIGYPVFVGLNVGPEGVAFKCFTVNVKNEDDERFLEFLDSDVFKAGLKLATTAQPAIAPLSQLALGVTRSLAERNRNVPVQEFYMGLDFSGIATRAALAEGSYVAVQIPEASTSAWDWTTWRYKSETGAIVSTRNNEILIPHNYVIFSVSRSEEAV